MIPNEMRRHAAYIRMVRSVRVFAAAWLTLAVTLGLAAASAGLFPDTPAWAMSFVAVGILAWAAAMGAWVMGVLAHRDLKQKFTGLKAGTTLSRMLTNSMYRDAFRRR
jgi:hypothetical protein